MQIDRRRWLVLSGALVGAVAVAGAGFAAGRGTESPAAPVSRATPTVGPVGTELDLDGVGFCFEPIPGLLKDGRLDPGLGGFEARYLGDGFALVGIEFGAFCQGGHRGLKTNWVAANGGWKIMVTQAEGARGALSARGPYSLSFSDGGFQFFVMALDERGYQAGASDPSVADLQPVLDEVLRRLAPGFRAECFERSVAKDWPDLAALGIGDPRPAIPEGIVPLRLDFTMREAPAEGCPLGEPNQSEFQFQAMFTDRHDNLFSIHISGGPANSAGFTAVFQPGSARWASNGRHFSVNWHPGLVSDDAVRTVARVLDPSFDTICAVRTRALSLGEIEAAGFRVPGTPEGFSHMGGGAERAFAIEPTEQCEAGTETGFFADWMLSTPDIPGFIQVIARRGPQDPSRMPPPYDESRMIYWKDARGGEYWVTGVKAIFERETLLEFARGVDPNFDESQLTAPPNP